MSRRARVLVVSGAVLLGLAGTGVAAGLDVAPPQPQPQVSVAPPQPQPQVSVAPPQPQPQVSVAPPQPQPQVSIAPPQPTPQVSVAPPQPTPQVSVAPAQPTGSPDPQVQNVNPQDAATGTSGAPAPAAPQSTTSPQSTAGEQAPPAAPAPSGEPPAPDVSLQGGQSSTQVQGQSTVPIQGGSTDTAERLQHANPGHALEGNQEGGGTAGIQSVHGHDLHLPSGPVDDAADALNRGIQERKTAMSQRLRAGLSAAGGNGLKNAAKVAKRVEVLGLGAAGYGAAADFIGDQKEGHSKLSSAGYTAARVAGGTSGAEIAAAYCLPAGVVTLGVAEVACTAVGALTGQWLSGLGYKAARGDEEQKRPDDPRKDVQHVFVLPLL
jgi:hypothetical protein